MTQPCITCKALHVTDSKHQHVGWKRMGNEQQGKQKPHIYRVLAGYSLSNSFTPERRQGVPCITPWCLIGSSHSTPEAGTLPTTRTLHPIPLATSPSHRSPIHSSPTVLSYFPDTLPLSISHDLASILLICSIDFPPFIAPVT